jgi:hypothetical protein
MKATIVVEDDGKLAFNDASGTPLSPKLVDVAKKQHGDAIHQLIEESCEKYNATARGLAEIHLHTPAPQTQSVYQRQPFPEDPPREPRPKPKGFWGTVLPFIGRRIEAQNVKADADYRAEHAAWAQLKADFERDEDARKEFIEHRVLSEVAAMEQHLEAALKDITWPRETTVSFDILEGGKLVAVDVDLPELEDMPDKVASVPGRQYRLSLKAMSQGNRSRLYASHVHGIGFRIIGEVYAILPTVQRVVLSGYSQRPDKATGAIQDDYLYSVVVDRDAWSRIQFTNLSALDPVHALEQFDLRRQMTAAGKFANVEPHAVSS